MTKRCFWAESCPTYREYHDLEWGVPLHDDNKLFEMLILEGAQAGLSWITILKRREGYREAYDYFDPAKVALYDEGKKAQLLQNPGIIRNRLKVNASINNAQKVLEIQNEFGSLNDYLWQFVDFKPLINNWEYPSQVPAQTEQSNQLSDDLKKRGLKFVGSTICYALMQAIGMVQDHTTDCFRYKECSKIF